MPSDYQNRVSGRKRSRTGARNVNDPLLSNGASCEAFSQFFRLTGKNEVGITEESMMKEGFQFVRGYLKDHGPPIVNELVTDNDNIQTLCPSRRPAGVFPFSTMAIPDCPMDLPKVASLGALGTKGEAICLSKTWDLDTTYAVFRCLDFLKEFKFLPIDSSVAGEIVVEQHATRFYVEPDPRNGPRGPPRVLNNGMGVKLDATHTFSNRIFLGRTRNDNIVSMVQLHRKHIDRPSRRVAFDLMKIYLEDTVNGEGHNCQWFSQQQPKWSTQKTEHRINESYSTWSQKSLSSLEEMLDQPSWMQKVFSERGVKHVSLVYNEDHTILRTSVISSNPSDLVDIDGERGFSDPGHEGMGCANGVEEGAKADYPYGHGGPMSDLWKFVYFVNESGARIPSCTGPMQDFDLEFLDFIGEILENHTDEDYDLPEGETWKHLVDTTVEKTQIENIKWSLFLHSVRENMFGMIESRCIWFCHQHHRHQLCDVVSLEHLSSGGTSPLPLALEYNHNAKLWKDNGCADIDLARKAASLAMTSFDGEYHRRHSGSHRDGGFCFVSVSIGMEVKVARVSEKRISDEIYYDMKPLGDTLPCEYFGDAGKAIRLHWSIHGAYKLRDQIRQAYNQATEERPHIKRKYGSSSAVIDKMNTIYSAWGCGKKKWRGMQGNAFGRPCQTKSALHLFADHVDIDTLQGYFRQTIQNRKDLDAVSMEREIRFGLFNLLLPTQEESSCISYPVLNIYEGVYRAAPKKTSKLRDGSKSFLDMAMNISGAEKGRKTSAAQKINKLTKYVNDFQKEIWEWHDACPLNPALRIEDCSLTSTLKEGSAICVEHVEWAVCNKALSRIKTMMNVPLKDYLIYSRRFELEETIVNTIPIFTMMCRRGEQQLKILGRADPSLVDHLALLVGLVQHVIFGWDRVCSDMKKYFMTSLAAKFLRQGLETYGFICGLPATFFFGGSKGFITNAQSNFGEHGTSTWNVVNHLGKVSFLSQNVLMKSLKVKKNGNPFRWELLTTVLSDVLHHLDITLWPRLMMELLAINFLELLCIHSDFGMAVELVTNDGQPVGYRMRALWKIFGYGDSHDWQFVQRCLPSSSRTPLEHRASSFLCKKAIADIADILDATGDEVSRTGFASEWAEQIGQLVRVTTGEYCGHDPKDIHTVMFKCMISELRRIAVITKNKITVRLVLESLLVQFMHLLPGEYWSQLRRGKTMRENIEKIHLRKLGPVDPDALEQSAGRLYHAQRVRSALFRDGGILQEEQELSNLLANQWMDTVMACSFSMMHFPNRRMNEMSPENIMFVQHADRVPADQDDPSSTYCPDFGEGPGTRPFGAPYAILDGQNVYRNGLLLVNDTDNTGIPTKFVLKK